MPQAELVVHPLPASYVIARFEVEPPEAEIRAASPSFFSLTLRPGEISVVCEEAALAGPFSRREGPYRCFELEGPIAFNVTGVVHRLTGPLSDAGIGLFVISTYDTDFMLVPEAKFERAKKLLNESPGIRVVPKAPDSSA